MDYIKNRGFLENKIIEIHGSAIKAACLECEAKQNILDFHEAIKFQQSIAEMYCL
jgi:NAD-dependent SIR2 family protein deacetylase